MDRRIINNRYSESGINLYLALAQLTGVSGLYAAPVQVLSDKITMRQNYDESPLHGGSPVYYRLNSDCTEILVFDPEIDIMERNGEGWDDDLAVEALDCQCTMRLEFNGDPNDAFRIIQLYLLGCVD